MKTFTKTEVFLSVFVQKRSSVNGALESTSSFPSQKCGWFGFCLLQEKITSSSLQALNCFSTATPKNLFFRDRDSTLEP